MVFRLFILGFIFSTTLFSYERYGTKASSDFEIMAQTYANMEVEYPNLKAVTLAMMMLESGRGSSDLAKVHKNYAGLKYRSAIKKYAQKVKYRASDGYDYYCQFKDHETFIKGFWAFLDRSPYKGWRQKAYSPRAFLTKIASKYCPFNKEYVSKVMNLVPEAEYVLNKYKKSDDFKIALLN